MNLTQSPHDVQIKFSTENHYLSLDDVTQAAFKTNSIIQSIDLKTNNILAAIQRFITKLESIHSIVRFPINALIIIDDETAIPSDYIFSTEKVIFRKFDTQLSQINPYLHSPLVYNVIVNWISASSLFIGNYEQLTSIHIELSIATKITKCKNESFVIFPSPFIHQLTTEQTNHLVSFSQRSRISLFHPRPFLSANDRCVYTLEDSIHSSIQPLILDETASVPLEWINKLAQLNKDKIISPANCEFQKNENSSKWSPFNNESSFFPPRGADLFLHSENLLLSSNQASEAFSAFQRGSMRAAEFHLPSTTAANHDETDSSSPPLSLRLLPLASSGRLQSTEDKCPASIQSFLEMSDTDIHSSLPPPYLPALQFSFTSKESHGNSFIVAFFPTDATLVSKVNALWRVGGGVTSLVNATDSAGRLRETDADAQHEGVVRVSPCVVRTATANVPGMDELPLDLYAPTQPHQMASTWQQSLRILRSQWPCLDVSSLRWCELLRCHGWLMETVMHHERRERLGVLLKKLPFLECSEAGIDNELNILFAKDLLEMRALVIPSLSTQTQMFNSTYARNEPGQENIMTFLQPDFFCIKNLPEVYRTQSKMIFAKRDLVDHNLANTLASLTDEKMSKYVHWSFAPSDPVYSLLPTDLCSLEILKKSQDSFSFFDCQDSYDGTINEQEIINQAVNNGQFISPEVVRSKNILYFPTGNFQTQDAEKKYVPGNYLNFAIPISLIQWELLIHIPACIQRAQVLLSTVSNLDRFRGRLPSSCFTPEAIGVFETAAYSPTVSRFADNASPLLGRVGNILLSSLNTTTTAHMVEAASLFTSPDSNPLKFSPTLNHDLLSFLERILPFNSSSLSEELIAQKIFSELNDYGLLMLLATRERQISLSRSNDTEHHFSSETREPTASKILGMETNPFLRNLLESSIRISSHLPLREALNMPVTMHFCSENLVSGFEDFSHSVAGGNLLKLINALKRAQGDIKNIIVDTECSSSLLQQLRTWDSTTSNSRDLDETAEDFFYSFWPLPNFAHRFSLRSFLPPGLHPTPAIPVLQPASNSIQIKYQTLLAFKNARPETAPTISSLRASSQPLMHVASNTRSVSLNPREFLASIFMHPGMTDQQVLDQLHATTASPSDTPTEPGGTNNSCLFRELRASESYICPDANLRSKYHFSELNDSPSFTSERPAPDFSSSISNGFRGGLQVAATCPVHRCEILEQFIGALFLTGGMQAVLAVIDDARDRVASKHCHLPENEGNGCHNFSNSEVRSKFPLLFAPHAIYLSVMSTFRDDSLSPFPLLEWMSTLEDIPVVQPNLSRWTMNAAVLKETVAPAVGIWENKGDLTPSMIEELSIARHFKLVQPLFVKLGQNAILLVSLMHMMSRFAAANSPAVANYLINLRQTTVAQKRSKTPNQPSCSPAKPSSERSVLPVSYCLPAYFSVSSIYSMSPSISLSTEAQHILMEALMKSEYLLSLPLFVLDQNTTQRCKVSITVAPHAHPCCQTLVMHTTKPDSHSFETFFVALCPSNPCYSLHDSTKHHYSPHIEHNMHHNIFFTTAELNHTLYPEESSLGIPILLDRSHFATPVSLFKDRILKDSVLPQSALETGVRLNCPSSIDSCSLLSILDYLSNNMHILVEVFGALSGFSPSSLNLSLLMGLAQVQPYFPHIAAAASSLIINQANEETGQVICTCNLITCPSFTSSSADSLSRLPSEAALATCRLHSDPVVSSGPFRRLLPSPVSFYQVPCHLPPPLSLNALLVQRALSLRACYSDLINNCEMQSIQDYLKLNMESNDNENLNVLSDLLAYQPRFPANSTDTGTKDPLHSVDPDFNHLCQLFISTRAVSPSPYPQQGLASLFRLGRALASPSIFPSGLGGVRVHQAINKIIPSLVTYSPQLLSGQVHASVQKKVFEAPSSPACFPLPSPPCLSFSRLLFLAVSPCLLQDFLSPILRTRNPLPLLPSHATLHSAAVSLGLGVYTYTKPATQGRTTLISEVGLTLNSPLILEGLTNERRFKYACELMELTNLMDSYCESVSSGRGRDFEDVVLSDIILKLVLTDMITKYLEQNKRTEENQKMDSTFGEDERQQVINTLSSLLSSKKPLKEKNINKSFVHDSRGNSATSSFNFGDLGILCSKVPSQVLDELLEMLFLSRSMLTLSRISHLPPLLIAFLLAIVPYSPNIVKDRLSSIPTQVFLKPSSNLSSSHASLAVGSSDFGCIHLPLTFSFKPDDFENSSIISAPNYLPDYNLTSRVASDFKGAIRSTTIQFLRFITSKPSSRDTNSVSSAPIEKSPCSPVHSFTSASIPFSSMVFHACPERILSIVLPEVFDELIISKENQFWAEKLKKKYLHTPVILKRFDTAVALGIPFSSKEVANVRQCEQNAFFKLHDINSDDKKLFDTSLIQFGSIPICAKNQSEYLCNGISGLYPICAEDFFDLMPNLIRLVEGRSEFLSSNSFKNKDIVTAASIRTKNKSNQTTDSITSSVLCQVPGKQNIYFTMQLPQSYVRFYFLTVIKLVGITCDGSYNEKKPPIRGRLFRWLHPLKALQRKEYILDTKQMIINQITSQSMVKNEFLVSDLNKARGLNFVGLHKFHPLFAPFRYPSSNLNKLTTNCNQGDLLPPFIKNDYRSLSFEENFFGFRENKLNREISATLDIWTIQNNLINRNSVSGDSTLNFESYYLNGINKKYNNIIHHDLPSIVQSPPPPLLLLLLQFK